MNRALSSSLRAQEHPHCVACAPEHPAGLRMQFQRTEDGGVTTTVQCAPAFQGYAGLMHGGVISLMLDAAMTNCLFERGVTAFTARLNIRFREPLHIGKTATISARIVREFDRLFVLEAQIRQADRVKANAEAVFMRKMPAPAGEGKAVP